MSGVKFWLFCSLSFPLLFFPCEEGRRRTEGEKGEGGRIEGKKREGEEKRREGMRKRGDRERKRGGGK